MNEYWSEYPIKRGFDSVKELYSMIGGRGFIAGSYAAFMAYPMTTPILPNDIDVFAISDEAAKAICLDIQVNNSLVYLVEENPLVYTLHRRDGLSIQIVKPHPDWKVFPDDILNSFDLDVSRAVLVAPDKVLADVNVGKYTGKLIRVNDPLRSLKRVMKYAARGVSFNDHELLKLFQAWDQISAEHKQRIVDAAVPPEYPQALPPLDSGWFSDDDYYNAE